MEIYGFFQAYYSALLYKFSPFRYVRYCTAVAYLLESNAKIDEVSTEVDQYWLARNTFY